MPLSRQRANIVLTFEPTRNSSLDWTGKKVAVIGNGSSAIQIVPQLQKDAGQLTNYIRSPTWISTNFAAKFTKDGRNFAFTEEEKQAFRDYPASLLKLRKEIEHEYAISQLETEFPHPGN